MVVADHQRERIVGSRLIPMIANHGNSCIIWDGSEKKNIVHSIWRGMAVAIHFQ
jgi:hypothetical protein